MKLLVFGGSGLVGGALKRVLGGLEHEIVAPTRFEYDILNGPPPRELFRGVSAVVNVAVVKPPPPPDISARVNSQFPHELAAVCAQTGAKLIHLSSDGVFSGVSGPYNENAARDPNDEYGVQKLAGEPEGCLVLRTSVIGPEQRGYQSLLCWFLQQKDSVSGYVDQQWNGVTSLTLARAIGRLAELDLVRPGVRHIYSDDVSKFELLSRLAKVFARDVVIRPARAPVARDRRLRTLFPEFLAACALPPLDEQLAELPSVADGSGAWKI